MSDRRRMATLLAAILLSGPGTGVGRVWAGPDDGARNEETGDMARYEMLRDASWREVFFDTCTKDWREKWFLDGLRARITHGEAGMDFAAGPEERNDACHAVLWTRESFAGDVKIEYEYTRLDRAVHCVTILYIQATGSGTGEYAEDISLWSPLREVPSMSLYFNHMNLYHVSYAAFGNANDDPDDDYIRTRRYMPETGKGLRGTDLAPDYLRTGLFATGVPHRITVIKRANEVFMHIRNADRELLCRWPNPSLPPVVEGRIGLRHMYTRSARYRDFRISVPTTELPGETTGQEARP